MRYGISYADVAVTFFCGAIADAADAAPANVLADGGLVTKSLRKYLDLTS